MKKLLFIFTGGTIGSTVKGEYICTDENKPYVLIEGYKKKYGELGEYDDLNPYTVLSENLNGEHLSKLIKTIGENIKKEYDKKKIFILNDVREAFPLMNRLAGKEEKSTYVLLENDLPDLFNE